MGLAKIYLSRIESPLEEPDYMIIEGKKRMFGIVWADETCGYFWVGSQAITIAEK